MDNTRASLLLGLTDPSNLQAWEEFAAAYSPTIYRVAIRRGLQPADAENLVQEVMTAVAMAIEKWLKRSDRGRFRHWLFTIARNETINLMTRRATRPIALAQDGGDVAGQLENVVAPDDMSRELELEYQKSIFHWAARQVEMTVDELNWQAFWNTAVEGVSANDTATQLNINVGQVYCARGRVMAKIKRLVRQYRDEK